MKTYTKTFHEIHTSEDGERWHRVAGDEGTPEGLARLKAKLNTYKSCRHVRLVHATKHVNILEQNENTGVLSEQEIRLLLETGKKAVEGILGIDVTQSFEVSMDTLHHGPVRVVVAWSASKVLGKYPAAKSTSLEDRENARKAKLDYNNKAVNMCSEALAVAEVRLKAAGVKYVRAGQAIRLLPENK